MEGSGLLPEPFLLRIGRGRHCSAVCAREELVVEGTLEAVLGEGAVVAVAEALETADAGGVVGRDGGAEQLHSLAEGRLFEMPPQKLLDGMASEVGMDHTNLIVGRLQPFAWHVFQEGGEVLAVTRSWNVKHSQSHKGLSYPNPEGHVWHREADPPHLGRVATELVGTLQRGNHRSLKFQHLAEVIQRKWQNMEIGINTA